jgi:hypothetical protein
MPARSVSPGQEQRRHHAVQQRGGLFVEMDMVLPAAERWRPNGQNDNCRPVGTRRNGRAHSGRHDPDVPSFVALAPGATVNSTVSPSVRPLALISLNLGVVDEEVRTTVAGQEAVAARPVEELHVPSSWTTSSSAWPGRVRCRRAGREVGAGSGEENGAKNPLLHAERSLHALDLLALLVGHQRDHGARRPARPVRPERWT